jgi:hypothetical protein
MSHAIGVSGIHSKILVPRYPLVSSKLAMKHPAFIEVFSIKTPFTIWLFNIAMENHHF